MSHAPSKPFRAEPSFCCNPWGSHQKKKPIGNDAELAREMNALTFEERERVFDDVHGVAQAIEETPELIESCIDALIESLAAIPQHKRKAFNRACFLWPNLQADHKFLLMFLRAEQFDARKAAYRMVSYYEQKRILFGEEKLVKTLHIDDLSDGDLEAIRSGFMVELPTKDHRGCPVLFYDIAKLDWNRVTVDNIIRALWYTIMVAMAGDTAQRQGFRMLTAHFSSADPMAGFVQNMTELTMRAGWVISYCLPARYSSQHFCYDNPRMEFLVNTIRMAVISSARLRFRAHLGSDVENEYILTTFGIKCDELLQRSRGGDTSLHENYIQRRKGIENRSEEDDLREGLRTGIVPFPGASDVLIGRGRPYRDFPGNEPWNELIHSNVHRYRTASSQFEKTCVTMDVVKIARESKTIRFLLEPAASGGWKVLDDVRAREKAASALHNRAKVVSRAESPADGNAAKRPRYDPSIQHS